MRHFKTHFGNIQSVIVWNQLILAAHVVFMNEISPHFLSNEPFFVDGIEKDEDSTTDSLDLPKDLNGVDNPVLNIHISVMIFLSSKQ